LVRYNHRGHNYSPYKGVPASKFYGVAANAAKKGLKFF
jgi:hypothetical protein